MLTSKSDISRMQKAEMAENVGIAAALNSSR